MKEIFKKGLNVAVVVEETRVKRNNCAFQGSHRLLITGFRVFSKIYKINNSSEFQIYFTLSPISPINNDINIAILSNNER